MSRCLTETLAELDGNDNSGYTMNLHLLFQAPSKRDVLQERLCTRPVLELQSMSETSMKEAANERILSNYTNYSISVVLDLDNNHPEMNKTSAKLITFSTHTNLKSNHPYTVSFYAPNQDIQIYLVFKIRHSSKP